MTLIQTSIYGLEEYSLIHFKCVKMQSEELLMLLRKLITYDTMF